MLQQVVCLEDMAAMKDRLPFDLNQCPTVAQVMSPNVTTAAPSDRIPLVAQRMQEYRVSCVVVVGNQTICGILTQKDFLCALHKDRNVSFARTAADYMATDVSWILPSQNVFEASQAMEKLNLRHLPVMEAGHLVGMVTQTDLIRALISFGSLQGVEDIMCRNIAVITVEASVQTAIDVMAQRQLSCVIVQDKTQPLGIITERDIVRRIAAYQQDPQALPAKIFMSSPLKSIDSSFSIHSAGRLMDQKKIHRLVVVDNNKLSGMITQTDVLKAVQCGLQSEHVALDAQKALLEVKEQLVQNDKLASIGQLAAGVAHELNTPVGFVNNNLETLSKYVERLLLLIQTYEQLGQLQEDDNQDGYQARTAEIQQLRQNMKLDFMKGDILLLLSESREGLEHVTSIVRNLRDFSRADRSTESTPYDLNKGIRNTLIVAHNALKYDIDVQLELAEVPTVMAHGPQINQVILNIVSNAAQAITAQEREGLGTITLRSYTTENWLVCEIADNGPGIAPENLSKIFESFFTTKPADKGTGLGLSVSYDIITKKHQGELLVSSEVDKGTTFFIKLPLSPTQPLSDDMQLLQTPHTDIERQTSLTSKFPQPTP